MTGLSLSLGLGLAGGAVQPPAVANQSVDFGALTLEGAGGWAPTSTAGPITSAEITGGTVETDFDITSTGVLSPSSTGAGSLSNGTVECTFGNTSGEVTGVTITVTAVANAYHANPTAAEIDAACDAIESDAAVRTLYLRDGTYILPTDNPAFSYDGGTPRTFGGRITIQADNALLTVFRNNAVGTTSIIRGISNVTFKNIKWDAPLDGSAFGSTKTAFSLHPTGTDDVIFDTCEFDGHSDEYDVAALTAGTINEYSSLINHNLGSGTVSGLLHFKDCNLHGASKLINLPETNTGTAAAAGILLERNSFHDFSLDAISFPQQTNCVIRYNDFYNQRTGTNNAGHADFIQRTNGSSAESDSGILIYGNRFNPQRADMTGMKSSAQMMFIQTGGTSFDASSILDSSEFVGNLGLTTTAQGWWADRSLVTNSKIVGNTIIELDGATYKPTLVINNSGSGNSADGTIITENAVETITVPSDVSLNSNNVTSASTNKATIFDGSSFAPTTIADMMTALTPTTSQSLDTAVPKVSAIPYVDWDNYQIDHPRVNRVTSFTVTDKSGQTASTEITSAATQITNIDMYDDNGGTTTASVNGALVWLTGGNTPEFRITDDDVPTTVISDWGSTPAIIDEDEYLWVRDLSSASAGGEVNVTVNVGATSDIFTITTVSISTVFQDAFTDTNGVDLTAHTPDTDVGGGGWTNLSGVVAIQSNKARGEGTAGDYNYIALCDANGNADGELTWKSPGTSGANWSGVVFRASDADNLFFVLISQTVINLYRRETGTNNLLGSYTHSSGIEHTGKVVFNESSIEVFLDDVSRISGITDTFQQTTVGHGVISTADATTATIDDFLFQA